MIGESSVVINNNDNDNDNKAQMSRQESKDEKLADYSSKDHKVISQFFDHKHLM